MLLYYYDNINGKYYNNCNEGCEGNFPASGLWHTTTYLTVTVSHDNCDCWIYSALCSANREEYTHSTLEREGALYALKYRDWLCQPVACRVCNTVELGNKITYKLGSGVASKTVVVEGIMGRLSLVT